MKNIFKVLTLVICSVILTTTSTPYSISAITFNENLNPNKQVESCDDEDNEIKQVIEEFFDDYENRVDKEDLEGMSYDKYFVSNGSDKTTLNIALIDTMLYQNILSKQSHYSGQHIKELNKHMSYQYSAVEISENIATVDMCVYKTFNYNICPDIESATMDRYIVSMTLEDEEWKIVSIDDFVPEDILYPLESQGVDFDNISSIKRYKDTILNDINKYNTKNRAESPLVSVQAKSSTYDASNAVKYANKYVLSPNPNYFNIESIGGDCTNFASQVMNEGGGIPEHFGNHGYNNCWFYTSSSNRSTSWAGADYLYDYMHSNDSQISFNDSNWSSVTNGDLIQVSYDNGNSMGHSMIVTGVVYSSSGRADLLVTYRSTTNNHKKNVLLSTRSSSEYRCYMHISGGV